MAEKPVTLPSKLYIAIPPPVSANREAMNTHPSIDYLADASIDDALDKEIKALLTSCFKKAKDTVFYERRYFREPYHHRWVMRNDQGVLVAHIGVHDKQVESGGRTFRFGGICEVCVLPECRGRGYIRLMLESIHHWLKEI